MNAAGDSDYPRLTHPAAARLARTAVWLLGLCLAAENGPAQSYRVLHHFGADGSPVGRLVLSGTNLYGATIMTTYSPSGDGAVFKLNTDGSGYAVLCRFDRYNFSMPNTGLVGDGDFLYGTTSFSSDANADTVFRVKTDGTGFMVLAQFAVSDFSSSWTNCVAGLVLSGDTLYGTTSGGAVFKLNTDGSGLMMLGGPASSVSCNAGPALSGSTLYVGASSLLFKINIDGTGYTELAQLDGCGGTGLALRGATLYGQDACEVFKINADGTGLTTLASEGAYYGPPVVSGATLYGLEGGGVSGPTVTGHIFQVNTDGSSYTILKTFGGLDGDNPCAPLAFDGRTLYGTTYSGGENGYGVVFSLCLLDILRPPLSQTAAAGSTVTMVTEAGGSPPLGYQWFFNATNPLASAMGPALVLTNVQAGQSGAYTVAVTNSLGAVTSTPAILTVVPPVFSVVTNSTEAALRSALAQGGTVGFAGDATIALTGAIAVAQNTLLDAGSHRVTISGNSLTTVFYVNPGITLTLARLTIADGLSTNGGAIYVDGGTVNATNCVFLNNAAAGAGGANFLFPAGGDAAGGAIYNTGTLNLSRCSFFGNSAAGGAGWNWDGSEASDTGGPGGGALGGAIYNSGSLTIADSLFDANAVSGGAGGRGRSGSQLILPTQPRPGGDGGSGGSATGAAVLNAAAASLVNCTLVNQSCRGGNGCDGGPGDTWLAETFHGPEWEQAPSGAGGSGGDGCGAIDDATGSCALTNCTLCFNSGTGGAAGSGSALGAVGASCGGIRAGGSQSINTLLAANSPGGNASGTLRDLGHNLSSDTSCAFTNLGSMNSIDPKLGALADNGGPTLTVALLPGSPAIDAGDTESAPADDQRGFPRPAGAAADIGAYEYGSPALLQLSLAPSPNIAVYGASGRLCYLLTSSNLVDWLPAATNRIGTNGTVSFPVATSAPRGFFRLVLP